MLSTSTGVMRGKPALLIAPNRNHEAPPSEKNMGRLYGHLYGAVRYRQYPLLIVA